MEESTLDLRMRKKIGNFTAKHMHTVCVGARGLLPINQFVEAAYNGPSSSTLSVLLLLSSNVRGFQRTSSI